MVCEHETMSRLLYNNFTGYRSTIGSNINSTVSVNVLSLSAALSTSNMVQSVANSTRLGLR